MGKMAMLDKMIDSIKTDPALDVSEWKNTLHFKNSELEKMTIEDLNGIEIPGAPERKDGDLTAVEMLVVSASQCYATTLELQAYNAEIPLDEVTITFTGKFAKAPFLSIREGNSGLYDPQIELTVVSSADKEKVEEIAKQSIKLSPVLSSLKEPVKLVVK